MSDFTVTFRDPADDGADKTVLVAQDRTVLDAAHDAGVTITATCGRRGRCSDCRVQIVKGAMPPATLQDTIQLGHDAVQERFRLACQTKVIIDCTVMPAPPRAEVGHQILTSESTGVGDLALDSGVVKRVVKAKEPVEENEQTTDIHEILGALGEPVDPRVPIEILRKVPSALRDNLGTLTVTTFNDRIIDIEPGDTSEHKYGFAFDIGTTSIVGSLIDLNTGEQLEAVGSVNPQVQYGGDLMSRIAYAQFDEKKLGLLRAKVTSAISDFIREACDKAGIKTSHVYKIVVVGNTCMHHIFLGIDVTHVGLAPYAPAVGDTLEFSGRELNLKAAPDAQVCLLPIIAGFVGADSVAAALATRVFDGDEIRAVVDIGTNGEVIMGNRERLMACSAPAGPALEGAQIKHGMRGAAGAIERVDISDDVSCSVINDAPAIGICGSGLIDAAAKMLDAGVVDPAGRLRHKDLGALPEAIQTRFKRGPDERFFVLVWAEDSGKDEDIVLTQMDIRQLQLAKGAIYAGICMLQQVMQVPDDQLGEVLVCGGFGNYLDLASAVRIRLLPDVPIEKITYAGNAAHIGAQMALLSETERRRADDIAQRVEHVALATNVEFQTIFVDACTFEEVDFQAAT